ncbi:MAG: hypothetical protein ACLRM9_07315 [Collinsella aerofaciens]
MSAADLPRVFEKGFTGDNGRTTKRATGIGLYLVAHACAPRWASTSPRHPTPARLCRRSPSQPTSSNTLSS